jgi:DNA primase
VLNLDEVDIEQLVSFEGYEYRLSSGNRGLQLNVKTCPACNRDDYKVYLNADSGLGNCFGCDQKFNKFSFVKFARGFAENKLVFTYLEGIHSNVKVAPRAKVFHDVKINKDWKLPLNTKILLDEDVPQYLLDRNIDAKIAKRFDLRDCQFGYYKYEDHSGRSRTVDFSNRIIIPIFDSSGRPATFQGRDYTGTAERKYLFPNMLPGTARYIYNAHYAINNRIRRVVLNEGVFDVFATTKALESEVGYKDWTACGTFGKHFSIQTDTRQAEDQLADLAIMQKAGVEEFCIMWDGEPKARIAAVVAALKLRAYGFHVTVALGLPDGCDPAECSARDVLTALDNRKVPTQMQLVRLRMEK